MVAAGNLASGYNFAYSEKPEQRPNLCLITESQAFHLFFNGKKWNRGIFLLCDLLHAKGHESGWADDG